tara:strand:+ start:429 stop:671 length:243 start_codon:yes stop_codon:yes gene_type:complete
MMPVIKDKILDKVWDLYRDHLHNQLSDPDVEDTCPKCALEHAVGRAAFFFEAEDVVLEDIYHIVKSLREQPDETSTDDNG